MILWLQLALCLGVIGIAGWHLSRSGDIIAEKTGLSASWVGLILPAALGGLLLLFVAFSLLLERGGMSVALAHVGIYTPLIVVIYLLSMRVVYQYEQRTVTEFVEEQAENTPVSRYVRQSSATAWRPALSLLQVPGFLLLPRIWPTSWVGARASSVPCGLLPSLRHRKLP